MMETVQLLNEKNHFLEKFYTLNERELIRLSQGEFEKIEIFYYQREDILKIIKYIDSQIMKIQSTESAIKKSFSADDQSQVKKCLKEKDMFVSKIIEQDIQIISLIERLKTNVIKELKTVRETKRAFSGYRSGLTID